MKLEHIAPYLPYKLNFKNEKWNSIVTLGLYNDMKHFGVEARDVYSIINSEYKPILRPLSDLTKEIEHNGERFMPYKELEKEFLMEGLLKFETTIYGWIGFTDGNKNHIPIYMGSEVMPECGYGIVKKLFEWHFDVFGLIEKSEAIDINTLDL